MIVTKRAGWLGCLAVVVLGTSLPYASASTTNLVPVADTSLRNNAPDTNFGSTSPLMVGVSKDPFTVTNRALLKFDFTGIPTNATVTSVTLSVTIFRSNTEPADYDLNRMLIDWSELDTTWNDRLTGIPWQDGGGEVGTEFVPTASVTAQVDETIFSSPGMTADVQLWLNNPGINFGWMMLATGEKIGTGKQLGSRESDLPPTLTVEYTLNSAVTPPTIFGTATTEGGVSFSFLAQSNRTYAVEYRDALVGGSWSVLTNIPAQPADAFINITNAISSPARFFRARTP